MKKNTLLLIIKLVFPYILIIAIPFLILFKVYFSSLEHAFQTEAEKNVLTLEQSSEYIDTQIKSFSELSSYIAYSHNMLSLLNLDEPLINHKDFLTMYEFCQRTPNYKLINPSIKDIYVFLGNLEYAIELPTAYRLKDFLISHNHTSDTFTQDFLSLYHYNEVLVTPSSTLNTSPNIFFVNSLPYGVFENINNQLVIELNTDLFFSRLDDITLGDTGTLFVLDASHNIILTKSGSDACITLDDLIHNDDTISLPPDLAKNYTLSAVSSSSNDWTYISVIPNDLITMKVNYIKTTILTLILVALFITFLLCCILGLRKGFFLINIFSNLFPLPNENALTDNPYKRINQGISYLRSQNTLLTHMVHKQSELLHTSIIKDILYGNYESPSTLTQTINALGIHLDSPFYCTVMFRLTNTPNSTALTPYSLLTKSFVTTLLDDCCRFEHYYSDIDTIHMSLLFLLPASADAPYQLTQDLQKAVDSLKSNHQLEVILAHGQCYNNLSEVKKSFKEASDLCEYATYRGYTGIILPSSMPTNSTTLFYYPLALELNLVQALHFEDRSKLDALLDELYQVNFLDYALSLTMIKHFTQALRHTLIHALSNILEQPTSPLYQEAFYLKTKLECTLSISELYECILDTHRIICGDCLVKKDSHNEKFISEIKNVVSKSYQDNNFNLSILAEHFQINENTLYKNFKELFGMTFSDYLENYRIEIACKLLSQKQTPIKDITILVGYNSDYSFRRAFKRCVGVPPSKYTDVS